LEYPIIHPLRRGLSESLEDYAARAGVAKFAARGVWRQEGLRLLNVPCNSGGGLCRVAPGVAVSVPGLTPADVIEHDNPRIGSSLARALAEWERRDP
jgi:hypothetical protein